MSEVSRKVTPMSSARWMVAIDSASSLGAVELGHPHAAESYGGHGQVSELSLSHGEDSSQPDARYAHLSMRIAPEVAEAVAGGRPVVALESTLISHGLPRPRNLEVARELEAAVRAAGAVPATIAVVAGEARVGLDEEALEAIARRGRGQVRRARPGGARRARRARRDDGGGHGAPGRARRDRSLRDRRAGRRAPRGARDLGRVRRPGDARARGHGRGLLGGQVDPRRGRDARAARDAGRDGARLRDGPVPRLLPARLGLPGAVAGRHAGRGRGRGGGDGERSGPRTARSWSANPLPLGEQLDPDLHDRVLEAGLAAAAEAAWAART